MKRIAICLILAAGLVPLAADDFLAMTVQASLTVNRPDEVQKTIVDWIEARHGACVVWSRARLSLRLPREQAGEFEALLKTLPCRVSGFTQSAEQVREQIEEARARIASRREVLRKNMEIMGKTNVVNTLDIEKAVTALIAEIEEGQGALRLLSYRARFAYIELSFQFQATTRPENRGSAFPVIRDLDMYDFIRQMRERYETKNQTE